MLANHIDITMVNVPQVIINLMVLAHTTLKKDMWARIQKVNKILALTTFLFTSTTFYSSFEMQNFFDIIMLFITADDTFHIALPYDEMRFLLQKNECFPYIYFYLLTFSFSDF